VIKKVAVGSNTHWRGKSYAASVPSSDVPSDAQRRRKRVSKAERQAMVQSFVNKYFFYSVSSSSVTLQLLLYILFDWPMGS
jgi:hypothetical protein